MVAVLVTLWFQRRKERRDSKRWVLTTLLATRHAQITDEAVRALNLIDIVFHDSKRLRSLWREYFEMLNNEGLNNPSGWSQRQTKNLEMITAMAHALGYGRAITHIDVTRVYYPVGLGQQTRRNEDISDELLRVLKGSNGLLIAPRAADLSSGGTPSAPD